MLTEPSTASLPLLRGPDTAPGLPMQVRTSIGMLMVTGEARERDGVIVQRCLCGCSQPSCAEAADVDTRFLNLYANSPGQDCALQGVAFYPDFHALKSSVLACGVKTADDYRRMLTRGYFPKGTPVDPSAYEEWAGWGSFLDNPAYQSNKELFDALLAMDLHSLGLLPRPERRRVLLLSQLWTNLRAKATEMGILENQIPDRLKEIMGALQDAPPDRARAVTSGSGTGGSTTSTSPDVPAPLTLHDQGKALVHSVTTWFPSGGDLQRELIRGFFASVWEMLDKQDQIHGSGGYAAVEEHVLEPLAAVKPELVAEFIRQHDGVSRHKRGTRNWMQAYSLWYSESHRRFINCSSAGLGKTRTIPTLVTLHDIHFTIFFSPKAISNAHNPQLHDEILQEDATALLYYSDDGVPTHLAPGFHHYFFVNPEKLQQETKTLALIDAMLALGPGLLVFDEGHLLVSSNLVDPESGEEKRDTRFNPRMTGLRYLLDRYDQRGRVVVLTGTPVRTDSREGQALFHLVGEDIGEMTAEMSEINALRLRAKLQEFGFHFTKHNLPELRRFILPFTVPDDVARRLNAKGPALSEKEKIRIQFALEAAYSMRGRTIVNIERVALSAHEASPATAADDAQALAYLSGTRYPLAKLNYEPMETAINPVFFSLFVDGPVETISTYLRARNMRFRLCTGDSDKAELGDYLRERDSCLIASSSWSTGVDGSQKASNTLLMLGPPWHDSGHRQTTARLHRQGACTPDGLPTAIIHEIIPVATNVAYDVKRLNTLYSRRSFGDVLTAGDVDAAEEEMDFANAIQVIAEMAE